MPELEAAVLEGVFDGIAVIDFTGIIQFANKAFTEISGYSKPELLNQHFSKLTNGSQLTYHLIQAAKKDQEIIDYISIILPKHATALPVIFSSRRIEDLDNILIVCRAVQNKNELSEEALAFHKSIKSEVSLTLFKMGPKGPALVVTESLPYIEGSQDEFIFRIGVYYLAALGQGNTFNLGLYGPLPLLNAPKHVALAYSFFIDDPTGLDPRTEGKTYAFIVITIPKALVQFFSNRNAIERVFEDEISRIDCVHNISLGTLQVLKNRILSFDGPL
ncbi:MAG: PAS domain S-box protein [Candidatus Thorarchaeota archaeon]